MQLIASTFGLKLGPVRLLSQGAMLPPQRDPQIPLIVGGACFAKLSKTIRIRMIL